MLPSLWKQLLKLIASKNLLLKIMRIRMMATTSQWKSPKNHLALLCDKVADQFENI